MEQRNRYHVVVSERAMKINGVRKGTAAKYSLYTIYGWDP